MSPTQVPPMFDVVTGLRVLEHRAEAAARAPADPESVVGLGVEARNLGVLLGTAPLPALAEGSIRERALLLTHHGEALARAALTGHGEDHVHEIMKDLVDDTHLLRGALEAAHFDGKE